VGGASLHREDSDELTWRNSDDPTEDLDDRRGAILVSLATTPVFAQTVRAYK
jgi:hypothetical protein